MITYGGRFALPLETYHGVPKGWTKLDILAAQRTLRGSYDLDCPEATEPGAPSWLPDRWNWLQYRATLYRVADGVRAGDHSCTEIAVRYIILHHIGSYSGFIRARLARALRNATLSMEQKERLNSHFLELVESRNFTEEFSEYVKLWRRIASPDVTRKLSLVAATHQAEPRWAWINELVGNLASKRTRFAPRLTLR
jgi:hypothetical protein